MSIKHSGIRNLLLPFSLVYGFGVWVRNLLFDLEILNSSRAEIPVIGVGNLTVGGTGKTPMVEYLARLLGSKYKVAILSRGYKRKSKGFVMGSPALGINEMGDEPTQMMRKYPDVVVAVDENRRRGIDLLSAADQKPSIDVILLDDAFQHRYVAPGLNILLIDYNRPISHDTLLPAGNLREPANHHKRADIILFTKCPTDISPIERRVICLDIKPYPYQSIFFTTVEYGPLLPVQKDRVGIDSMCSMDQICEKSLPVLIVAGIASPTPFINYVKGYCPSAQTMIFSDHHRFTEKDITTIKTVFESIRVTNGMILTTEKDAVRMIDDARFEPILPFCYYPTLHIRFLDQSGEEFDKKIVTYVQYNKRNS